MQNLKQNCKVFSILLIFISSGTYAGTEDVYKFRWLDPDKEVYVLQNKIHPNKNRVYLNIGYGYGHLSEFQETRSLHLNAGYYFSEQWAIELFYSNYSNSNNRSFDAISADLDDFPFVSKINQSYGAMMVFSPFYGKLNTFNFIYYLDWSFGLGAAQLNMSDNFEYFVTSGESGDEIFENLSETAIVAKTQVRFFLNRHWLLSFDFINYFFQGREPSREDQSLQKNWIRSYDFVFSVGYSF